MHWLGFLLIGLAAGWIAGKLTKGAGFGAVGNLVVGVLGAVIGGALFGLVGIRAGGIVGSLVMVWLDELIWRRFPLLNLLILGVATVMLVLFLPRGIVGTILRRRPGWRRYIP